MSETFQITARLEVVADDVDRVVGAAADMLRSWDWGDTPRADAALRDAVLGVDADHAAAVQLQVSLRDLVAGIPGLRFTIGEVLVQPLPLDDLERLRAERVAAGSAR